MDAPKAKRFSREFQQEAVRILEAGRNCAQLSRELGAEGIVIFDYTEKLATQFLPPMRLGVMWAPPLAGQLH